ncbi:ESX secretion-associated protein EspG [Nocardia sp. NPDC050406]|uniref:ESX secretion-associated protein EspG n=1 Tax=Nocardia sp. NPDC050406 TaxID=3364318 RepID=UPI0037A56982
MMWNFTESEFMVLWRDLVDDNLPMPFVSKSKAESYRDYLEEVRRAREGARQKFDEAALVMINAIAAPDLSVVVSAWDEQEPLKGKGEIRIRAVRQGSNGYLVKQESGETFWHGGGYKIRACDPLRLADEVVRELPEMAAGKQTDLVLPVQDEATVDAKPGGITVRDPMADSDAARAARFHKAATDRIGRINVVQGQSIFGPRGITDRVLQWRDVREDGRYVISDQNPQRAVPADAQRTVALINSQIASVIRVIKEERESVHRV